MYGMDDRSYEPFLDGRDRIDILNISLLSNDIRIMKSGASVK